MFKTLKEKILGYKGGLHGAAFVLALGTFSSQLLGLLRDRLLAQTFGAGTDLDLYYAAFRIPDLLYISVGSLLAVTVLVPFVLREKNPRPLLDAVFTSYLICIASVAALVWIFMPMLAPFVAPGFTPEALTLLTHLSRILLLSPIILGLSPLVTAILHANEKFSAYAFAPAFYNLGIIIGTVFFSKTLGIEGVVWGVIVGAFLHIGVQLPGVSGTGHVPHFSRRAQFSRMREVVRISIPRTITLGLTQFLVIVFTAFASRLGDGVISLFTFAITLATIPQALIGFTYSTAAFPALTKQWQEGKRPEFAKGLARITRVVLLFSIPVATLFYIFRYQITAFLLGAGIGKFTAADTASVASLLGVLSLGVVGQVVMAVITRGYFAMSVTRVPLLASTLTDILAIYLAWGPLGGSAEGLALAFSIDYILNGAILLCAAEYRFPGFLRQLARG